MQKQGKDVTILHARDFFQIVQQTSDQFGDVKGDVDAIAQVLGGVVKSAAAAGKRLEDQKRAAETMAGLLTQPDQMLMRDSAERFLAEADKLKAQIDRIERADDLDREMNGRIESRARNAGRSADEVREEDEAYGQAYNKFLRFGASRLTPADHELLAGRQQTIQNAFGEGSGAAGGYTVPTGFYRKLTDAQLAYGGMLEVATVIDTDSGNSLPMPTDNDTSNKGVILGEASQAADDSSTPFNAVTLSAYMFNSKVIKISLQLLQDSAFDLEAWIKDKAAIRNARAMNDYFTTGTGTGQPSGIVTGAASGKVGATGQTGSVIYDDLDDLFHSVDPAYRANAKWMMHDQTIKIIKKLKDTLGRPLWAPGIAVKEPDTILGKPFVVNQSMPQMAANAKSILFGDLSAYMIRRVNGAILMRLTERYADYGQVGFILWQRADGALLDAGTHPVAYYANSAT
jgi:HK97 family phage major capsid protein